MSSTQAIRRVRSTPRARLAMVVAALVLGSFAALAQPHHARATTQLITGECSVRITLDFTNPFTLTSTGVDNYAVSGTGTCLTVGTNLVSTVSIDGLPGEGAAGLSCNHFESIAGMVGFNFSSPKLGWIRTDSNAVGTGPAQLWSFSSTSDSNHPFLASGELTWPTGYVGCVTGGATQINLTGVLLITASVVL